MGFTALEAKTPVRRAPRVPPAPCTPNASSESSYRNMDLTLVTMRKQTIPAANPMAIADMGETKPAAGVIATSPATAPEIAPSALGFPRFHHSTALQPRVAAAAPKCVATNALVAKVPADSALPALNPNHPTHSKQAPMKLKTTLCGGIGCFG